MVYSCLHLSLSHIQPFNHFSGNVSFICVFDMAVHVNKVSQNNTISIICHRVGHHACWVSYQFYVGFVPNTMKQSSHKICHLRGRSIREIQSFTIQQILVHTPLLFPKTKRLLAHQQNILTYRSHPQLQKYMPA